jgi:hypothetical protein
MDSENESCLDIVETATKGWAQSKRGIKALPNSKRKNVQL